MNPFEKSKTNADKNLKIKNSIENEDNKEHSDGETKIIKYISKSNSASSETEIEESEDDYPFLI